MKRIFTVANELEDPKKEQVVELEWFLRNTEHSIDLKAKDKQTGIIRTVCSVSKETGELMLWFYCTLPGLVTDSKGYIKLKYKEE